MLGVAALVFLFALLLVSATHLVSAGRFAGVVAGFPALVVLRGLTVRYATTLLFIVVVGLIFYFVPNAPVRFRDVWLGAILTGLLWKVAFEAFSWLLRDLTTCTRVNGSIAAVVVFLVWVYAQAAILLFGVGFTAAFGAAAGRRRRSIRLRRLGTRVSARTIASQKSGHVVGLARRDEVAVLDDRLVHVQAAGVLDVDRDRRPAGERAAAQRVGRDEQLRSVADGGDRLAGLHRVAHEIDHRVAHAHPVGRVAAGDDERVEILDARRAGREVRRDDRLAALAVVLGARRRPDDRHRGADARAAASSGPVSSRSSNSSSTRIATRLPDSDVAAAMDILHEDSTPREMRDLVIGHLVVR